jgi:hypothetical protein
MTTKLLYEFRAIGNTNLGKNVSKPVKNRKQSMREVRDAAAVERASAIVATIGDIALESTKVPGNTDRNTPRYFRGALIKPK